MIGMLSLLARVRRKHSSFQYVCSEPPPECSAAVPRRGEIFYLRRRPGGFLTELQPHPQPRERVGPDQCGFSLFGYSRAAKTNRGRFLSAFFDAWAPLLMRCP